MSNEKTVTIFCDMDGVVAKWNPSASLEETYEFNYFREREPDLNCFKALKEIESLGFKIVFLSAVYGDTQADAKRDWLDKYGFANNALITCPYGECKRAFIQKFCPEYISDINVLIDDFTPNLLRWEAEPQFVGLKYLNGINDTHKSWTGARIQSTQMANSILQWILQWIRSKLWGWPMRSSFEEE